jgi:4-hydroxy-tetrahydrodipicolinate reductase
VTRIAVTGATGRMGGTVVRTADDRGDEVVAAIHHGEGGGSICGIEIEPAADFEAILRERNPDAIIDFTAPDATLNYVEDCVATNTPIVIGTTGFDHDQLQTLREQGEQIPILRASNFSRGVQVLRSALSETIRRLPGYDVELTETHHNGKQDAPSGTAKTLLEDIDAVREEHAEHVHGREGDAPREHGEIGVHSRRAGNVTGEHEILVAGNHEELRLTHRAEDRGVFAAGALDAADWIAEREPGWYDFSAVVAEGRA